MPENKVVRRSGINFTSFFSAIAVAVPLIVFRDTLLQDRMGLSAYSVLLWTALAVELGMLYFWQFEWTLEGAELRRRSVLSGNLRNYDLRSAEILTCNIGGRASALNSFYYLFVVIRINKRPGVFLEPFVPAEFILGISKLKGVSGR
jgi:hypothetical protein